MSTRLDDLTEDESASELEAEDLCPATLVESATADTAAEIADILVELLADETVPEAMRRDTRSRLADLYRRFPAAFPIDIVNANVPDDDVVA
jgi:hypothetical protein